MIMKMGRIIANETVIDFLFHVYFMMDRPYVILSIYSYIPLKSYEKVQRIQIIAFAVMGLTTRW